MWRDSVQTEGSIDGAARQRATETVGTPWERGVSSRPRAPVSTTYALS
jgi:hypothetical protein